MTSQVESLDANVLLRFALGDVPEQQARAAALLARNVTYRVFDPIWVEVEFALDRHYQLSRAEISDVICSLAAIELISVDVNFLTGVCDLYVRYPKLSFVDCLVASRAQQLDAAPLRTFDAKLAKQHESAALVP